MINSLLGFIELGGIVLAWLIFWNYLLGGFMAHHSDWPSMQGLAAILHS